MPQPQPVHSYLVEIHHENDVYWASVPEVPGCFATGDDLDELEESLREALALALGFNPAAVRGGWDEPAVQQRTLTLC